MGKGGRDVAGRQEGDTRVSGKSDVGTGQQQGEKVKIEGIANARGGNREKEN